MKNLKKKVALLLAFVMVLSLVPAMGVFGATDTTGIISGTGYYAPAHVTDTAHNRNFRFNLDRQHNPALSAMLTSAAVSEAVFHITLSGAQIDATSSVTTVSGYGAALLNYVRVSNTEMFVSVESPDNRAVGALGIGNVLVLQLNNVSVRANNATLTVRAWGPEGAEIFSDIISVIVAPPPEEDDDDARVAITLGDPVHFNFASATGPAITFTESFPGAFNVGALQTATWSAIRLTLPAGYVWGGTPVVTIPVGHPTLTVGDYTGIGGQVLVIPVNIGTLPEVGAIAQISRQLRVGNLTVSSTVPVPAEPADVLVNVAWRNAVGAHDAANWGTARLDGHSNLEFAVHSGGGFSLDVRGTQLYTAGRASDYWTGVLRFEELLATPFGWIRGTGVPLMIQIDQPGVNITAVQYRWNLQANPALDNAAHWVGTVGDGWREVTTANREMSATATTFYGNTARIINEDTSLAPLRILEVRFRLATRPDVAGPITATVSGPGATNIVGDTTREIATVQPHVSLNFAGPEVVAAAAPFMPVPIGNITITEARPGALGTGAANHRIIVELIGPAGIGGLFGEATLTYTARAVGGGMALSAVAADDDDVVGFHVTTASTEVPAQIVLENIVLIGALQGVQYTIRVRGPGITNAGVVNHIDIGTISLGQPIVGVPGEDDDENGPPELGPVVLPPGSTIAYLTADEVLLVRPGQPDHIGVRAFVYLLDANVIGNWEPFMGACTVVPGTIFVLSQSAAGEWIRINFVPDVAGVQWTNLETGDYGLLEDAMAILYEDRAFLPVALIGDIFGWNATRGFGGVWSFS